MKIFSVSNNKYDNVSFASGKVHVFSDFDKTYLPAGHSNFARSEDSDFVNSMRKYFADFKSFLERNKKGLKFTITTGRTYDEFETVAEISRKRRFGMPLPDTLICKNGSDEYIKIGSDADFYRGGYFPFDYNKPNIVKESKIKELTGWDGRKIKEKLTSLFKSHDMQVVNAGSEHGTDDYGKRSIFGVNNLVGTDPCEWKVAFRKDGNCKMFYILPIDMNSNPERKNILNHINSEMKKFYSDNSIKVHSYSGQCANECGGRPYFVIEPKVDDELFRHVSGPEDSGLTKLYDTKEAVKKALKNNDLVIIAGDASNDKIMLNPINYMLDELKKRNIDTSNIKANCPKSFIEVMEKHPEMYEIYKKMPFISVIERHVTDGQQVQNTDLDDLIQYFGEGKYKKIVVVENGKLQDGIKDAIKLYSEQNPKYKKLLSKDLLKEVFKINKAHTVIKYVIAGAVIAAAVLGYKIFSNAKNQKVKK